MVNPICLYLLIITLELSADFILLHFLLQSLMKNIQNPIFWGGTFRSSALFLLKAKSTSSSSLGFNHRKTILHSKNQRRSFRFIHSHHPSFHSLASILVYLKDPASFLNLFDLSLFIMIYPFIPFTSFILLIQQLPAQVL